MAVNGSEYKLVQKLEESAQPVLLYVSVYCIFSKHNKISMFN